MRRYPIVSLLLLLSCSSFLSCSIAPKVETVAAQWTVLGSVEYPSEQVAFVVAREATGAFRTMVGAHHLVQITRNDDGTFDRSYREIPCVIYVDEDGDNVMTPEDRRWVMPADHSCPVAQAELTMHIQIDDAAKTLSLTVRGPKDDPEPTSFQMAYTPRIEQQHQLPGLP